MQLVSGLLSGFQGPAIMMHRVTHSQVAGMMIGSAAAEPIEQVDCAANRIENNLFVPIAKTP